MRNVEYFDIFYDISKYVVQTIVECIIMLQIVGFDAFLSHKCKWVVVIVIVL
jgi:hypothetical protein